MKKVVLLALLASFSAQASIYEDLKTKFEGRPAASLNHLKSLPLSCASWGKGYRDDEAYLSDLVMSTFTYPGAGPLYPERSVSVPMLTGHLSSDLRNSQKYAEEYQLQQLADRIRLAPLLQDYFYYEVDFKFDQYLYFKVSQYKMISNLPEYQVSVSFGYCWRE